MKPSAEQRKLLTEAIKDKDGIIIVAETMGAYTIQTNEINLSENASAREIATWKDAIEGLLDNGYISRYMNGPNYALTKSGWDLGDAISAGKL